MSERFHLRPLHPKDIARIEELICDFEIMDMLMTYPVRFQPPSAENWIQIKSNDKNALVCAICDSNDNFCGYCQIAGIHNPGRFGYLGIALLSKYRRRQIAKNAVRGLIALAAKRSVRKIISEVRADNEAAVYLHRQTGFGYVGRLRAQYKNADQPAVDVIVFDYLVDD